MLITKNLGLVDYTETMQAMRAFTDKRDADTSDELWLCEHPAVFTLGQAGKEAHILNAHGIPIVRSDRGGQVTYHGRGQFVAYCLLDLRRKNTHARDLVILLENVIINTCADLGVQAEGNRHAPGVYSDGKKIASIGLRIRRGCSYHGIAINVTNDLTPFSYINPCGMVGQKMLTLNTLMPDLSMQVVATLFETHFRQAIDAIDQGHCPSCK